MRFQVPQFIEAEDKLVGPLTLRQFAYIAVGIIIAFLLFFVLTFWFWVVLVSMIGAISVSLAFVTFNGRPLAVILLFALKYYWSPRLFLWRKEEYEVGYRPTPTQQERLKAGSRLCALWSGLLTSRNRLPFRASEKSTQRRNEYIRRGTGERQQVKRVDYL
jgi:hypothetical protein